MNKKRRKTTFALLSIGIVILTILLLPKREEKHYYEPPRSGVRYIPAPTPTPPDTLKYINPEHELPKAILPKDLK